jgi:hypothetical protein
VSSYQQIKSDYSRQLLLHCPTFRHPWRSDEAESDAASADDTQSEDIMSVSSHHRKSGGRKPLPERLPRPDDVHELPADELRCDHDDQPLNEIGEVISEQLDIIPATIQVIRHVRKGTVSNSVSIHQPRVKGIEL